MEIELQTQHTPTPPSAQANAVSFKYTLIKSAKPVAKQYDAKDGKPVKTGKISQLTSGEARTIEASGSSATEALQLFATKIETLDSHSLLVLTPTKGVAPGESAPVVTLDRLADYPGSVSRASDFYEWPAGPTVFGLDFDGGSYPEHIVAKCLETSPPHRMQAILARYVSPAFADAAFVERFSSSVGVRHRDTKAMTPRQGLHMFFVVPDGRLIPDAVKIISARLTIAGFGYCDVTKSGARRDKTIIDESASLRPERLWFEGAAILVSDKLEFVPGARDATVHEGGFLDVAKFEPLTEEEQSQLEQIREVERERVATHSQVAKDRWAAERISEYAAKSATISLATLHRAVDRSELTDEFVLNFDDIPSATVAEILAEPDKSKFNKKTMPDPLEPEYGGGRNKAILYVDERGARVLSHAHGGTLFTLVDTSRWFDVIEDESPDDVFGDGEDEASLELPRGAMPPALEDAVWDVAERIGVSASYTGAAALAAASGGALAKYQIQVKARDSAYTEPAFLAVCLVGDPAAKKSPPMSVMTAPNVAYDRHLAKQGLKARAEYDALLKQQKRGAAAAPMSARPPIRRATVQNATMEAVTQVLADNPRGTFWIADELAQVTSAQGQYKSGRGNDRSLQLSLLDGRDGMQVDRASKGLVSVETFGASFLTGTQPDVARSFARDYSADGFLQRILFVMGDEKRRRGVDREPNAAAMQRYVDTITALLRAEPVLPSPIRLSAGARKHWAPLERRIEALLDLPGMSSAWLGHLGKWQRFSARILLVCHLVDHASELGQVDQIEVSEETAARTVRLCNWLLRHALRFYSTIVGGGEAAEDARYIAGSILTKSLTAVTRHYLGQQRDTLRDPDRAVRAMRFLEAHNWVIAEGRRADRHGPQDWTVRPAVHDGRFTTRATHEEQRRSLVRARIASAARARRDLRAEAADVS